MPASRIIVHIGMHKTGTTAIQRLLASNHQLLLAAGVLHPTTGIPTGHSNAHRGLVHAVRHGDDGPWQTMADEVDRVGAPTVVISNEEFSRFSRRHVAIVADRLRRYDDVRVLVYVRNEWDFMRSACRQSWRGGTYSGDFRSFLEERTQRCHYSRYLDRWADAIGPDRTTVVLYDKVVAEPGLLDDFIGRLGLGADVEPVVRAAVARHPTPVNPSADDDVAMTVGRLNALEAHLPDRLTPGGVVTRLRRHLNRQTPTGRALVAVARPRRPMATDDDRTWLRDRTATWHRTFLDRYVDPADHRFLDF